MSPKFAENFIRLKCSFFFCWIFQEVVATHLDEWHPILTCLKKGIKVLISSVQQVLQERREFQPLQKRV